MKRKKGIELSPLAYERAVFACTMTRLGCGGMDVRQLRLVAQRISPPLDYWTVNGVIAAVGFSQPEVPYDQKVLRRQVYEACLSG